MPLTPDLVCCDIELHAGPDIGGLELEAVTGSCVKTSSTIVETNPDRTTKELLELPWPSGNAVCVELETTTGWGGKKVQKLSHPV